MSKENELTELYEEWKDCEACSLCGARPPGGKIVFGEGSPNADLFIVGGYTVKENMASASPMSGDVMDAVDVFLGSCDASYADVFISNVTACPVDVSTAEGRREGVKGARACSDRLYSQLRIVDPLAVLLLGKEAVNAVYTGGHAYKTLVSSSMSPRAVASAPGVFVPIEWPAVVTVHPESLLDSWSSEEGGPAHSSYLAWARAFDLAATCREIYKGGPPPKRRDND